ncbi:neck protein [Synechococcus phage S-CAM9]|uniref:Neck protein n=1 Tax=Synechococcus phage S-CAM9 TaxID=1883369 RepID=A0A1D8KP87_9CAUD|nr:head closure Hc2 [Synechococcus phage S-CAM9]AOV60227.1 neck protein [Synechococcus phage S-CAM9]AOV60454.1 neck protein [Synechococcus phage S-CAM9]AOV60683.1 neck protein [Synechococcus phage S-CAM9]
MTPLNPFFRQEVASEQRLVQDLVNEHLRMYGQEVYYMPRKYFGTDEIMRENILSAFDDAYPIEAYIANVEGFQGSGDLMTKFGIRVTDEATFVVSKERFEDYVVELMSNIDGAENLRRNDENGVIAVRPVEGDLIYFPLTDSLFEIKFVEHENPFYQLGQLYTYELRCELFEYEQEVIDTGIDQIDDNLEDIGYVVTLTLAKAQTTATAITQLTNGAVNQIFIENDGVGYGATPTVSISTSPNGNVLANATAVAIGTVGAGGTSYSVESIKIINPGFGYIEPPTVKIIGSGTGAKARAGIATQGAIYASLVFGSGFIGGRGYTVPPRVAITTSPVGLASANATAEVLVSAAGTISDVRFINAGFGYTQPPQFYIDNPDQTRDAKATIGISTVGFGTVSAPVIITDAGIGYTTAPEVTISNPSGFRTGIITAGIGIGSTVNSLSIDFAGVAYVSSPTLTISSPETGTTATASAVVDLTTGIITAVNIINPGLGYTQSPTVSLSGGIGTATATSTINSNGSVSGVNITYVGAGYTTIPTITFSSATLGINTGNYLYNEVVTGETGLATAHVKNWNQATSELEIYSVAGDFRVGEIIVGSAGTVESANPSHITGRYAIKEVSYDYDTEVKNTDSFAQNKQIEDEADDILDFTESNPFGTF